MNMDSSDSLNQETLNGHIFLFIIIIIIISSSSSSSIYYYYYYYYYRYFLHLHFQCYPKISPYPPTPLPTYSHFLALEFTCTEAYKVCKTNDTFSD
jgi:hypothetical protein